MEGRGRRPLPLSLISISLVTGGSGYIGRNILRALTAAGHEVRALARSQASADVVAKLGAEPVPGDLSATAALRQGMTGCGYLIHAAADTDHGAPSAAQEEANLQGTRSAYTTAKQAGVRRALHLSSEAVLLSGQPLTNADETTPIPATAAGGYSQTKAAAERIALEHSGEGLDVTLNIDKARRELGYSPVVSRERGLAELSAGINSPGVRQ